MVNKPWRIVPRPVMETILNNHAHHHRVPHPLVLHGPRGVGKTTLILERLLGGWSSGPHITGYVDFAESMKDYHPKHNGSYPWQSWSNCEPPALSTLQNQLEQCLESMAQKGLGLGLITSQQIFNTLKKWHGLNTALKRILERNGGSKNAVSDCKATTLALWTRAVFAFSARNNDREIDQMLGLEKKGKSLSVEEASYLREAVVALKLAKEIVKLQQQWRAKAVAHLNKTGGFSRSLANSCTDWPCLLLELMSEAAEIDHFQPKLVINNIDLLRHATLIDDSLVNASMYHDSLIWRIIALGANEMILPVIFVTSDSYYSYRAFIDFGFPDVFVSRENFGWTPQEAKMHMVTDYFSNNEWSVISEVLGPNPRHVFELYSMKQVNYQYKVVDDKSSTFEDIVDAYLAYLQIVVVNPAMDRALKILQQFVIDVQSGHISKDKLCFGAPWRHPPRTSCPDSSLKWAKLQLIDFVQSLVNAEFGLNYLADCSLEIFDDPSVVALIEVGLLYTQRDPSFIRPVSRGIQRCLVRWLVQEHIKMNFSESLQFLWHQVFRGRSYRHLLLQIGYK